MCETECKANDSLCIENLDPAFLYTWKGTRDRYADEPFYHSHDHLEMAFVLAGEGKYRIDDKIVPVKEGDLVIINPGKKHQALACPEVDNPATEFFVGASNIRFAGAAQNALPIPGDEHVIHTSGELRQKLFKLCASMEAEKAVCRNGRYFMLKAYLMQMLVLVIREYSEPEEKFPSCSFESINRKYVVDKILDYFEDHYNEKISLDQIAENMYLSPFYISKIFKAETGDTPIRHLINIRLEKARDILESGYNGSIQEVAGRVGYDDAYHFSKLYKKHFGKSPSQTRKEV